MYHHSPILYGLCLGHMVEYLRKPINLTIQPSISILSTLVQLLSVVLWKAVQQLKDGPGIGLHQERPLPTIFLSKLTKKRWESGNICFILMVGFREYPHYLIKKSGNISDFLQTFPANLHKTLNGLWTLYRENTEAEKTKHVTPPKTNIYPLKNAGTGR